MPLRDLHQSHRLAVALGVRHPEVPVGALFQITSLLVADERDGATVETAEPDHQGVIVRAPAVAVKLDPVVEQPLDVVERVRAVLVACKLDRAPDLFVRRRRLDALELALQLFELPGKPRASEQVEIPQARQALPQTQFVVSRHCGRRA